MSTLLPCISLWQPWASLVMCGAKKIETRSWPVPPRIFATNPFSDGSVRVLIHAAKTRKYLDTAGSYFVRKHYPEGIHCPAGAILGEVCLKRCIFITEEFAASLTPQERALGDYTPGRYAWVLDRPDVIPPHPYRGRQGWFWVQQEELPVREGFLDFPTAFRVQSELTGDATKHDPRCSQVKDAGFLCDCDAVRREWSRRVAAQRAARGLKTNEELLARRVPMASRVLWAGQAWRWRA